MGLGFLKAAQTLNPEQAAPVKHRVACGTCHILSTSLTKRACVLREASVQAQLAAVQAQLEAVRRRQALQEA